jgi:hypothetical protein
VAVSTAWVGARQSRALHRLKSLVATYEA